MENNVQKEIHYEGEIDLGELFGVLWFSRIKIIAITGVFAFISAVYALSVPNLYKAEILLAPAQSDSSDLSGLSKEMGGLASLAGVNIGQDKVSETAIAQEVMTSWSFIESFIAKNNISIEVFATEGWDRESNELKFDDDIFDVETQTWFVEDDNTGEIGPPTSWKLFESFLEKLSISEDKISGLVSLSIEHYSPEIAKQWSDLYLDAINSHMQKRQVAKVNNNLNYLQVQVEQTPMTEMREVFYNIIEEQIKDKMIAEASPEYVFVVVSPSMVPEEKSQPNRILILFLGTLVGGMLSLLYVLLRHYIKNSD